MKKFITTLCVLVATISFANEGPCRGEDRDCKPPKEAIEICEGQATDAQCQVTSPHGDLIDGTCQYTPDEKYFACKPERGPKRNK